MSTNPYTNAAGTYGNVAQKHTPDQRELESRVLLKSAKMMQDLVDGWDAVTPDVLEETLKYNRQIWMLFFDTAVENENGERSDSLRSNIINLANFIFKREMEILSAPQASKLSALIDINRNIAAGLAQQQKMNAGNAESSVPAALREDSNV